jgi:hypothetical protein
MTMKRLHILVLVTVVTLVPILVLVVAFYVGHSIAARSGAASIKIVSPAENALVSADEQYALSYEASWGAEGDHFHVWVDGQRGPGVYSLKGSYVLPRLNPGEHVITLKLVDTGHRPTGVEKTVKVTSS